MTQEKKGWTRPGTCLAAVDADELALGAGGVGDCDQRPPEVKRWEVALRVDDGDAHQPGETDRGVAGAGHHRAKGIQVVGDRRRQTPAAAPLLRGRGYCRKGQEHGPKDLQATQHKRSERCVVATGKNGSEVGTKQKDHRVKELHRVHPEPLLEGEAAHRVGVEVDASLGDLLELLLHGLLLVRNRSRWKRQAAQQLATGMQAVNLLDEFVVDPLELLQDAPENSLHPIITGKKLEKKTDQTEPNRNENLYA